ncbi:hypothetical protein ABIE45_000361 [Methylobacterium sp. OAE515]
MSARSNLAPVEPPRHHPRPARASPLIGAAGGALAGLASGDPLMACVGHGVRLISLAQRQEPRS